MRLPYFSIFGICRIIEVHPIIIENRFSIFSERPFPIH